MIRRNAIFEHTSVSEFNGTELGDSAGKLYPLSSDTIVIDRSELNIKSDNIKQELIKLLQKYTENILG